MYENVKEDKILFAHIEDLYDKCINGYTMGNSGFLDLRQQSLVKERYRYDSAVEFYGDTRMPRGEYAYLNQNGFRRARRSILQTMKRTTLLCG